MKRLNRKHKLFTNAESQTHDTSLSESSKKRRVVFIILWMILWPILVTLPAIGVFIGGLYVAQLILGGEQAANENFISAMQIAILAGLVLLVIILQLLKKFLTNRRRLFFRSGSKVLGIYIWVGLAVGGVSMVGIGYQPGAVKPLTKQEPQLTRIITDIGGDPAKLSNVSVSYVDNYNDGFVGQSGEYTPYNDQHGNFSFGVITIKRGLDPEVEKVLVAHEYLHHIWETQIDSLVLHDLTSQLMTLYGKDDELQNRVATYSDTNMLSPTELFAYYCTESSDQYLSQYVLSQCNKHINRGVLRFAR